MPTAPILRGDDTPQLQQKSYQFDWRRGMTYVENWKGISPDKMIAKWNGNVFSVSSAHMMVQNDVAELNLEWSGDPNNGSTYGTNSKSLTIDRWEIPQPKTEKPIVQSPQVYDSFYNLANLFSGGATDALIGALVAIFQRGVSNNSPPADMTFGDSTIKGWFNNTNFLKWTALDPASQGYIIRAYNRCLNGQTHYQSSTYSVQHTTNVPSYWTGYTDDANVNRVYSVSQLLAEIQSSQWLLPCPNSLAYTISAAHSSFLNGFPSSVQSRSEYMVGWLKSPSSKATTGRNRVEIQTSYVLDQWPLDIYPLAG